MARDKKVRTPRRQLQRHNAEEQEESYSRRGPRKSLRTDCNTSPKTKPGSTNFFSESDKENTKRKSTGGKKTSKTTNFPTLQDFEENSQSYQQGGRLPSPIDPNGGIFSSSGKSEKNNFGKFFFSAAEETSSMSWVEGLKKPKRQSFDSNSYTKKPDKNDPPSSSSILFGNTTTSSPIFGQGSCTGNGLLQYHASNIFERGAL